MKATRLQLILICVMAAIVVVGGVSYYFLSVFLQQKALEANHAKIDATLSQDDINNLKALQDKLLSEHDVVVKAQDIVGSAKDFSYQDQVINDINALANKYGVGITGYSFPAPAAAAAAPTGKIPLPAGIKQVTVTINTKSPLAYDSYLRFLRALELNLTHLQVTGVNLTPDSTDPNQISNSSIGVNIYVKG